MSTETTVTRRRCVQWIESPTGRGTCQCSRNATHVLDRDPSAVAVCTQHARSYDRPGTIEELTQR